jgi:hypothetical protein
VGLDFSGLFQPDHKVPKTGRTVADHVGDWMQPTHKRRGPSAKKAIAAAATGVKNKANQKKAAFQGRVDDVFGRLGECAVCDRRINDKKRNICSTACAKLFGEALG